MFLYFYKLSSCLYLDNYDVKIAEISDDYLDQDMVDDYEMYVARIDDNYHDIQVLIINQNRWKNCFAPKFQNNKQNIY